MATNGFSIAITATDKASASLDSINKRIAALNAPAERFNKALARLGDTTGLSRLTEGVRGLGAGAADAFRSLDRMSSPIAALTGAGGIAGMAMLTRKWAEFGTQVGNVSYRLNMPAEQLGALRGAMRLAGGSAADVDSGLKGLGNTISGAAWGRDAGAVQFFRTMNIDTRDAHGNIRKTTDVLGDLADRMKGMSADSQRRVLEGAGLGEGWLPLLKNGRAGLQSFEDQATKTGGVMTGEMVESASAMNKAFQKLGLDVEGVGNRIVDSWSGTVTGVLDRTSNWIERNKELSDSIGQVGIAVSGLALLKPAAWVLRLLGLGFVADLTPVAAPILALGAEAGRQNAPMLDDYGRQVGTWGGSDQAAPTEGATGNPIWNRLGAFFGYLNPKPITVPTGPSAAAATMRHAHDFFRGKGLTEEQTAGILANIGAESGFNPAASGDGGTSYGLFQHHGGRLAAMRSRYGAQPSEQNQLDFAWDELNHSEKGTLDALGRSKTDARYSGAIFATNFERPADGPREAMRRGQAAGQFVQDHVQVDVDRPVDGRGDAMRREQPSGLLVQGHVQVDVNLKGATAGTTAIVTTRGPVRAPPPRIETSLAGVH